MDRERYPVTLTIWSRLISSLSKMRDSAKTEPRPNGGPTFPGGKRETLFFLFPRCHAFLRIHGRRRGPAACIRAAARLLIINKLIAASVEARLSHVNQDTPSRWTARWERETESGEEQGKWGWGREGFKLYSRSLITCHLWNIYIRARPRTHGSFRSCIVP